MKEVLYVFGALLDADIDALMRLGTREDLPDGSALIEEGRHPGRSSSSWTGSCA